MLKRPLGRLLLSLCAGIACLSVSNTGFAGIEDVPAAYRGYFVRFVDHRSLSERLLNLAGLASSDVGRSFALIAGVSRYRIAGSGADLRPAAEDVRKLVNYITTYDSFDEIVVLTDDNVTESNLSYFLEKYFPRRLRQFPKSRFLLAYSGHGMTTEDNKGYLLMSTATNFADFDNAISMVTLRAMFQEVVDAGHHVLALINACYSGAFIRRSFASAQIIPKLPGAHVIVAGGAGENTWQDDRIGSGSIFFEKVLAALDGRTQVIGRESGGDGIVTVDELATYLRREIQAFTDQRQNPIPADLSKDGSRGSFFFWNRRREIEARLAPEWDDARGVPFGMQPSVAPPPSPSKSKEPDVIAAIPAGPILREQRTLSPTQVPTWKLVSNLNKSCYLEMRNFGGDNRVFAYLELERQAAETRFNLGLRTPAEPSEGCPLTYAEGTTTIGAETFPSWIAGKYPVIYSGGWDNYHFPMNIVCDRLPVLAVGAGGTGKAALHYLSLALHNDAAYFTPTQGPNSGQTTTVPLRGLREALNASKCSSFLPKQ
jgi:hypothetical protein